MVVSEQVIFYPKSDRFIYLEYNENKAIIGINFMQGDERVLFDEEYRKNDENVLRFINSITGSYAIKNRPDPINEFEKHIDWVDDLLWLYVDLWGNFSKVDE